MTVRRHARLAISLLLAVSGSARAAEESGSRPGLAPSNEIDASALSKQPKLTKPATPIYPPEAVEKRIEAEVALLIDLDDKGAVTGVAVLSPKEPTGMGFEEAAVMAAYQLGFEPAEVMGKPTAVQINYTFKFVPPKPAPPPPPPEKTEPIPEPPKPVPVENLTGVLIERGTRLPISGVTVTVYRNEEGKPAGFEATTDAQGVFHFFDLAPGSWKVLVEPPGYYPFRTSEEIKAGEATRVTYYVERGSYNPFDQLVTAPRPRKEVTRVVIEREVIDQTPGAMGDPLAVIQNYAGVARVQGMMGEIIVRGSAPKDTQVFVDGVTVPIVYHFGGLRSVLPTGMIENLDFYPGNFSPYYGRANGGVIDVTLRKLKPKKVGGYADVNLLDSGIYLEAPIGDKAAIAVAGRRSYIDAILNAVIPDNAPITGLTLPVYYDFQVLGSYRPAPAHDLRLFFFGSDDRFAIIFKNSGQFGTELTGNQLSLSTTFYKGIATYKFVPSERFENTVRLAGGRDEVKLTVFQFYQNTTLDSLQLRDTARFKASDRFTLVGGLDTIYQKWSGGLRMPNPPREGEDPMQTDISQQITTEVSEGHWLPAAFAEAEITPLAGLLLIPGVRVDYFSDIHQTTLAPRLTVRYQLREPLTLKAGIGLFYQEPTVDESNKDFGNPDLKCERGVHYSLGTEWKIRKHISLDTTAFYKDLDNLVSRTDASKVVDGRNQPLRYDNHGVGRVYGLEVTARHETAHKFTGWLAYTLMRSERRDSGETSYRLFQYDQTHILTVVGMYSLPRNWQVSSRLRLVSGNPETPVVGSVFDSSKAEYQPTNGAPYSSRAPMFYQLDLRVDKRWVFNRWMFNAYLDIQNVSNHTNVEGTSYNYDYSKSQSTSGIPIYPILGLRGEF
jgi:TonB family protein